MTPTPAAEPALFSAVLAGDAARLHALVSAGADLSVRDPKGDTALHLAAYREDADATRTLLDHGAKPNLQNDAGATPLLYGAGNEEIVRVLLRHGANPNLASKIGVTPLMAAASHRESHEIVRLLLQAGADPHAKRDGQEFVMIAAVYGADPRTIRLLLDAGASPQQTKGPLPSPLATAVYFGDADETAELLKHGADVNFDSDFAGHALNWALYSGHTDLAALLINKGSDLHFRSPWGHQTSPMVFAGYSQLGDPTIARMLVEHGADVNEANEAGETALSFALRSGPHSALVAYLKQAGARTPPTVASAKALASRPMPKEVAVGERAQRAIDLLQRASTGFVDNRFVRDQAKCVSCHHQTLPEVAFAWGSARGLRVDEVALGHQLDAQLKMWLPTEEHARQMDDPLPDAPVQIGYGLMGLKALGYPPDSMTEALVRYLIAGQSEDGSWHWTDLRPPLEGGRFTATAWAVRALQFYPPPHAQEEARLCLSRARRWLRNAEPKTFGDQVQQLIGLSAAGESPRALRGLADSLISRQRADGGWAQLADLDSDAWATGEALVALHDSGCAAVSDKAFQRGVQFLLQTQFEDGSWWVHSRTWPFQPHFDSGFPHGNDQWISAGGTAWATLALLLTLEPKATASPLPSTEALVAAYLKAAAAQAPKASLAAKPASSGPTVDFSRQVYPILERSCVKCHSGEKPKAGFVIASREGLLKGGKSGEPAVVPGNGADSPIVVFASDQIEDLEMPPLLHRDRFPSLSPSEINLIQTWIDQGAEWKEGPKAPVGQ